VFYTADPSADVRNAERVYGVLNNGRLFSVQQPMGADQ
jgi:hypothetical protein